MFSNDNFTFIKLCLSTTIRDLRWNKQKVIQRSPFETNARWNATQRDTSANDIRRIVDETSTINPDLRKELLSSWERVFIEDKPIEQCDMQAQNLLREAKSRKIVKALRNPLKGRVILDTLSTVKPALGAIYQKIDIAKTKMALPSPEKHVTELDK